MHENKLLDIDDIALLSFGKNDGKFCCKRCMHMVKYLDEVAAHHKYHQLTDAGFVNQENLNPQFTSLPQKPKKNFKSMHHQKPAVTLPENHLKLQREPPRFCHSLQINRHKTERSRQQIRLHVNHSNIPNIQPDYEILPTHRTQNISSAQMHESPSKILPVPFLNLSIPAVAVDFSMSKDNFKLNNAPENYYKDDPLEAELSKMLLLRKALKTNSTTRTTKVHIDSLICEVISLLNKILSD